MKTVTPQLINDYLEAKERVWSYATYNSERARLRSNIDVLNMAPIDAYTSLKESGLKPYSIKTLFIRFANFTKFFVGTGKDVNKWQVFLTENPQLFRNVYEKEVVPCSFEAAKEKIASIKHEATRLHAHYMLMSGLRIHETYGVQQEIDGSLFVVGKGGKKRKVFMKAAPKALVPEHQLRAALKEVGLKPHSLRKLLATELFNRDFKAVELCKVMGWTNLQTAMSYLQSRNDAAIMAAMDLDGSENSSDRNKNFMHPYWYTKENQTLGGKIGEHEVKERNESITSGPKANK